MSNVDDRLSYIERQIIGLEKDQDSASKLADKFDASLDKMSEAVSSIKELLAIHDSQIRRTHDAHIESRRAFDEYRKDASEELEKAKADILEKVEDVVENCKDHGRRITGLERLMWMGMGLIAVLSVLLDKVPFDKVF